MASRTSCLPDDVLIEILITFPLRSVLRFRRVSKSWSSLITSRVFSKVHSKRHPNIEYRMMLRKLDGDLKHFSLGELFNEHTVSVFDTTNQFPVGCSFVGSCDGLICMAMNDDQRSYPRNHIVLWNPSIQKTKKLPDFGAEKGYCRVYGFGYDETHDDYKVVAFYFSFKDKLGVLVKIFSLKTGEFIRIKLDKGRWVTKKCHPTFANGKIHWFEKLEQGEDNYCYIAYLDLATEEYGKIDRNWFMGTPRMISLPGGSLYVSHYNYRSIRSARYVWLVEPGYGVEETTWDEVIQYSPDDSHHLEKYLGHGKPLFMFDNGEIVSFSETKIVVVNPINYSSWYPRLSGHHRNFNWGIAYVESLVSP